MAMVMARCASPVSDHPADEGREGGEMDHRRIEPRGAVGDAAVGRAAGLGRFHHARHLGQEGVLGRGRRLEGRAGR